MNSLRILVNFSLGAVLSALVVSTFTDRNQTSKPYPEYKGVDPKAAPYVDEFLSLAKKEGIVFDDVVTVGFKDIPGDNSGYKTIGLTNYGVNFREIDIDQVYWDRSNNLERKLLLFHELGHSYCDRDHDFGKGTLYGKNGKSSEKRSEETGFFKDDCPLSIMFPLGVGDDCALNHYAAYIKELFNRCQPY